MAIRSDDITQIIKSAIDQFDAGVETRSVGTVVEVGDGIARIYGLAGALASELLEFPNGIKGMALNLEEETVGAVILGDYTQVKEGDTVKTTGTVVEVPVGVGLVGRVVDPLGRPLDDKGPIVASAFRPVERVAPGVITRKSVDTPMQTGIKAIDAMIPIGRGQRELIIGDRQTGKHDRRHRRDHQPEGQGRHLRLRGDRPEAVDRGQDRGRARAVRRHGAHDRRGGRR
jgi:F-type H+-transporting ATPase subunit alpha